MLLWAPLPFYALSVAYGSVPIFVPTWWPFSQYNVRYGLQLLPAFAVFVPLAISFLVQSATKIPHVEVSWSRWADVVGDGEACSCWRVRAMPRSGARTRSVIARLRSTCAGASRSIGNWRAGSRSLPPDSTLLMYLGEHAGALEQAGIPLRRSINEGNHRVWKQPVDPEGLWERALADPAAYADYVVGFEGDPVWTAAEDRHLKALVEIHTTGQPRAAIFQGRTTGQPVHSSAAVIRQVNAELAEVGALR